MLSREMADTSLDAYSEVKITLKKRQKEVFQAVFLNPNKTAAEISKIINRPPNAISGRFKELREIGKISRVEKRRCNVTKGMAWTWRTV